MSYRERLARKVNAVRTGLTSRTVVLLNDDVLLYREHLDRNFVQYAPTSDAERTLVQSIADTEWRMQRIAPAEAAIYAMGRREFAELFSEQEDPEVRKALIDAETFATYSRDFRVIANEEQRLYKQRSADIAKLNAVQKQRIMTRQWQDKEAAEERKREIDRALEAAHNTHTNSLPFLDPAAHGFDFSRAEFEICMERIDAIYQLTGEYPGFDEVLAAYRAEQKRPKAA